MTKNSKKSSQPEQSVPPKERECGLCGMPQAASEFSMRTAPSPNCRRCERAYNMLHFHERMSMPVVRGNIRALGGPGLLVTTYKRKGQKALDLNQSFVQRRHRRSTRSDGPVDEASQSTGNGEAADNAKPSGEKEVKGKAEEGLATGAGEQEQVKTDRAKVAHGGASENAEKLKPGQDSGQNGAEGAEQGSGAAASDAQPAVLHTQEELDLLGKHGGIKIIDTDLGKRFVYKRKRAES